MNEAGPPPAVEAPALEPLGDDGPPRPPREVTALGRAWPRAAGLERAFWAVCGLGGVVVLALSLWLRPDARGIGTHEQLGLPPCGFVEMLDGVPCPSCGFTTTFALAAHGRPAEAFRNQPFGFVLFCLTVLGVPVALGAAARGVSLFEVTDRWPWGRLFCAFLALWLLAWLYKWLVLMR
ncbi:MAG: DUF2752 domain-containing protein [Planctomycetes bacterium]|nr:DUF2752 domain-containing protein [Planctomycetota bacterium]